MINCTNNWPMRVWARYTKYPNRHAENTPRDSEPLSNSRTLLSPTPRKGILSQHVYERTFVPLQAGVLCSWCSLRSLCNLCSCSFTGMSWKNRNWEPNRSNLLETVGLKTGIDPWLAAHGPSDWAMERALLQIPYAVMLASLWRKNQWLQKFRLEFSHRVIRRRS